MRSKLALPLDVDVARASIGPAEVKAANASKHVAIDLSILYRFRRVAELRWVP